MGRTPIAELGPEDVWQILKHHVTCIPRATMARHSGMHPVYRSYMVFLCRVTWFLLVVAGLLHGGDLTAASVLHFATIEEAIARGDLADVRAHVTIDPASATRAGKGGRGMVGSGSKTASRSPGATHGKESSGRRKPMAESPGIRNKCSWRRNHGPDRHPAPSRAKGKA